MSASDQTTHVEQGPDDRSREERKRDRQTIEPRTACASTRKQSGP